MIERLTMEPAVILALVADLYGQVLRLTEENAALRQQIEPGDKK